MQKSIRTVALAVAFSLTAVPMVHADRMGTNPPPASDTMAMISAVVSAALMYYGL